jgi:hypothetical protein
MSMPAYDPQRSRPRRRATDEAGPAPVDELLDAGPDRSAAPVPDGPELVGAPDSGGVTVDREAVAPSVIESAANGARGKGAAPVVVDLAPAPDLPPAPVARGRGRVLLVVLVVALAVVGFAVRRIGARRRARSD